MKALKPLKLHLSQTILHSLKLTAKAPEHQILLKHKHLLLGGKTPFGGLYIYIYIYLSLSDAILSHPHHFLGEAHEDPGEEENHGARFGQEGHNKGRWEPGSEMFKIQNAKGRDEG